jgi:hypothetical protein
MLSSLCACSAQNVADLFFHAAAVAAGAVLKARLHFIFDIANNEAVEPSALIS